MPMATAMPIRDWRNCTGFSAGSHPRHDARVAVATVAVKKAVQSRQPAPDPRHSLPRAPMRQRAAGRQPTARTGGNLLPAYERPGKLFSRLFAPLLQLLFAARVPVLLDCRLRQILMLCADHTEYRSCPIAATRNRTKLDRTFAALANDNAAANGDRATAPIQRGQSRLARTRHDFLLDHRRQLVDELLHDFLKIGTSRHRFPPVNAGRRLASKRDARNA